MALNSGLDEAESTVMIVPLIANNQWNFKNFSFPIIYYVLKLGVGVITKGSYHGIF